MNFLGTTLELTENVSTQFTQTNVSSSQVYHQPLECEALLVKVLKNNQRYPPLSITYKLILVQTISNKTIFAFTQCTSDIDNSVAKRSDTGKTVVYCRTRHLAGKLFL